MAAVDDAVQAYIASIDPEHRPLFDRLHRLILAAYPEVAVGISYGMPTYRANGKRLHVGVWPHGVSIYGWPSANEPALVASHPSLRHGKATIRLRPADAAAISDVELLGLVAAALG
jgi:uncharacterized protein YdhG (YjbR/CyaY superfamily)